MKVASIDIGTNTVLMLVAASVAPGQMTVLRDRHAIARLGEGVDRSHTISEEAYKRCERVLEEHLEVVQELEVENVAAVATSAMRDASNQAEVLRRIRKSFAIPVEILSGDEEAEWTYRGSLAGLESEELRGTIATLDIGGGSTELALGDGLEPAYGKSLNIGAVRFTERFFAGVATPDTLLRAREEIRSTLQREIQLPQQVDRLIAVAGTPTSLAAMDLDLPQYDALRVDRHILTREKIESLTLHMFELGPQGIVERYAAIHRARADILLAGTLILSEVMEFLGIQSIQVSTKGLRYGIAIREFERAFETGPRTWSVTQ